MKGMAMTAQMTPKMDAEKAIGELMSHRVTIVTKECFLTPGGTFSRQFEFSTLENMLRIRHILSDALASCN